MYEELEKRRILIAEDEEPLRDLIQRHLESLGYEVTSAEDGIDALEKFRGKGPWDMIALNIMMPRLDGFAVLQEIRKTSEVPVIFLSALDSSDDIVRGFDLGADDYITKPFTLREVAVRIKAILRRVDWLRRSPIRPAVLRNGDIELDTKLRQVIIRGEPVHFTPVEYNLLQYFLMHIDAVIKKDELFREVWGYEFKGSTNLVEVAVRRLRAKIEDDPANSQYIRTVRGVGYKFCHVEPSDAS